ncbi:MAG: UDP-N-acetylglucosamine 2-epimerase [Candidatus Erwinia impunctatus]|nr:UDP-N-acetylglucosamine 2-epimerase [Culicoides impunctatus]
MNTEIKREKVKVLAVFGTRPAMSEAGTVMLLGTDSSKIVSEVTRLLTEPLAYQAVARAHNPYQDDSGCQRIVQVLKKHGFYDEL